MSTTFSANCTLPFGDFNHRCLAYRQDAVPLTLASVVLVVFSPLILLRVLLCVLIIIFRDKQPIKSRFPSPLIMIILSFGVELRIILYNVVFLSPEIYPLSTTGDYFLFPGIFPMVLAVMFLFMRYFITKNLNTLKLIKRVDNKAVVSKTKMMLFNVLRSNITLFVCLIIAWFEQVIILTGHVVQWYIDTRVLDVQVNMLIIVVSHILIVSIVIAVILLWDIIMDVKDNGISRLALRNDPLNYRLDSIFLVLATLSAILGVAFLAITPGMNSEWYQYIPDPYALYYSSLSLSYFFFFLFDVFFIMLSGGTCVIMVMRNQYLKSKDAIVTTTSVQTSKEILVQMMTERRSARLLFEEYVKNEFSSENVVAYDEIQSFKVESDVNKKLVLASNIYNIFVMKGTASELNLPDFLREKIQKTLQGDIKEICVAMDDLENEVINLLGDTFGRFKFSSQYQVYIKSEEIKHKAMVEMNMIDA